MKILIATDVARQKEAGTAGVLLNYAKELQIRGHTVELWFAEDLLSVAESGKRFASLVFAIRVAKRISKARGEYDVAILHAPVGCVYGLWRRILKPAGSPPYVFVMQGILERYALAMKREDRKGRAWFRMYHRPLYECAIRTADYGVASNREAWTYPELRYDIDPGRLWYVSNGTEERFFTRREFEGKSPLQLLYVGTWLDRKGVYYLVQAFGIVLRERADVELTVAGCLCSEDTVKASFPEEIRGKIQARPYVKRDEMPTLYQEHDVFLLPSLMEGMPLALMEAMATGLPVITTETSGMADVGGRVLPADAESLARAIIRLHDSVELRALVGEEAQRTMRRYTWANVTRKLEMVLCLAMKGRTAS